MTADLESHVKTFARQIGESDYKNLDQVLLDGIQMSSLGSMEFLKDMTNLELLSMNFCKLKGIDTPFPAGLPLARLELSDNELTPADLEKLSALENLTELHLNEAKIETAKDLEALKALKNLKILMVLETELAKKQNYREEIFSLLPQLEIVDGFDKEGNEVSLSEDEDEDDSFGEEDDSEEEGSDELDDSEEDSEDDDEDDDDAEEDDEEDDSAEEEADAPEPAAKKPRSN